ncbi:hypothetical protein CVT25_004085 [Psilocybe cyanescens]|uniref:Uncharacterized protein n=1 Tax=Psilocybe cyanescens TaxID=93625 RepID=A0A409X911_PSICY|nr:hypothetical protein CVT25_004085 [Psilocybe cyanescens]
MSKLASTSKVSISKKSVPANSKPDSDSDSDSDWPDKVDINTVLTHREEQRDITVARNRNSWTLQKSFLEFINGVRDIKPEIVMRGVDRIMAYAPVQYTDAAGVSTDLYYKKSTKHITLDTLLPPEQKELLLLMELKPGFVFPALDVEHPEEPKVLPKVPKKGKQKEVVTYLLPDEKSMEVSADDVIKVMQLERKEHKKETMRLKNEKTDLEKTLEALAQQAERTIQTLAQAEARFELALAQQAERATQALALEAERATQALAQEAERATQAEARLQLSQAQEAERATQKEARFQLLLARETERASQAEKALAEAHTAQAEKQEDVDAFIASGCRNDTVAYYRIKIRHLINLTQASLAYFTGITPRYNERNSSKQWRAKFNHRSVEQRVNAAKDYISKNIQVPAHKTAIDTLVASGALNVLVDDGNLRTTGDDAAHPGPLTSENAQEYRTVVSYVKELAYEENIGLKGHLDACIDFLLVSRIQNPA